MLDLAEYALLLRNVDVGGKGQENRVFDDPGQ